MANKNHTFIFQTLKINCIVMLFNIFRTELICARFTWIFRSSVLIMPINADQGRAENDSLWIEKFLFWAILNKQQNILFLNLSIFV